MLLDILTFVFGENLNMNQGGKLYFLNFICYEVKLNLLIKM